MSWGWRGKLCLYPHCRLIFFMVFRRSNYYKSSPERSEMCGFTLIELLIVISVVSILTAILVRVINVTQQKKIAQDGVNKSTLQSLSQGILAYQQTKGSVPPSDIANPASPDTAATADYIVAWPPEFRYLPEGDNFKILIPIAAEGSDGDKYYIFDSAVGKIEKCIGAGCAVGFP
jgi:prepilin-type N-terminal cleavage/methylation domain-containing protein